jgi:hypothetical protein
MRTGLVADRDPVARRAADQRSARAHRDRSGREDRVGAGPLRQGREAKDGRDGRLGVGARCPLDRAPDPASGRSCCSASSPGRLVGAHGRRRPLALSSADSLPRRESVGGLRRTSSVMRTPSRWPTRGSRCRLSRASAKPEATRFKTGTAGRAAISPAYPTCPPWITSIYLQGIDTREIVDTVHHRRPPVIPASAGLRS